ncbi:MAG: hypothetical protein ACI4EV_07045 [Lachnospiraceae bacterium]
MKKLFYLNSKLPAMLVAQCLYFLIGELVVLVVAGGMEKLYCSIGFLLGVLYGMFATIYMSYVINRMMYMPDKLAVRHSLAGFGVRMVVLLAVLGVCWFLGTYAMLAALAGVFSMKVSAYIQPFTDKLIQKNIKKGR